MKKRKCLLLSLMIMSSLCACGSQQPVKTVSTTNESIHSSEQTLSNETESQEIITTTITASSPAKKEFGTVTGQSFDNSSFGIMADELTFETAKEKASTTIDYPSSIDVSDCQCASDFLEKGFFVSDVVFNYEDSSWLSIRYYPSQYHAESQYNITIEVYGNAVTFQEVTEINGTTFYHLTIEQFGVSHDYYYADHRKYMIEIDVCTQNNQKMALQDVSKIVLY